VVVRNMPIADFPDEPSVLDAILETSDYARALFKPVFSPAAG
jgi:hypothetical protein